LVNEDSQPALWVLITIYRRLLEKMAARQYDVFSERVSVSVREKPHDPWQRIREASVVMTSPPIPGSTVAIAGGRSGWIGRRMRTFERWIPRYLI